MCYEQPALQIARLPKRRTQRRRSIVPRVPSVLLSASVPAPACRNPPLPPRQLCWLGSRDVPGAAVSWTRGSPALLQEPTGSSLGPVCHTSPRGRVAGGFPGQDRWPRGRSTCPRCRGGRAPLSPAAGLCLTSLLIHLLCQRRREESIFFFCRFS